MSSAVETTPPHSAQAGHWGKEVRSDAHVALEARDSGGVEIALESRVAPYYGSAILEQAREVLAELGIQHAQVAITMRARCLSYSRLASRPRPGALE